MSRRILGEEHPETLKVMNNLGATLIAQGDLSSAREFLEQVLAMSRRILGEEHPETLSSMNNLASTLNVQGDLCSAHELFEQVLTVRRRILGEEHPETLTSINNLAQSLYAQGDLSSAQELAEQVLAVSQRILGEEHPETLSSMNNLAGTLHVVGDLADARQLYERVIAIREELAGPDHRPDSHSESVTFSNLAMAHRDAGNLEAARAFFLRGLDAAEAQTQRADISEDVRSNFRAQFSANYRAAIATSSALKRHEEAFIIAERYRAQSLTLLAAQNLSDRSEIPPELEDQRDEVAARYNDAYRELDRLSSAPKPDKEAIRELAQGLDRLRRERDVVEAKIRQAVRGDNWQPSKPLPLDEIRRTLDPGTLLISYILAGKGLDIFLLSRQEGLVVRHEDVDPLKLWLQVLTFRQHIKENRPFEARDRAADWLYQKLLQPVADRVAASDRLLILPDGPLHYLPFAALKRPTDDSDRQYLIEWKPLHLAASASVYASLRQRAPPGSDASWQLVAFGDPVYPGPKVETPEPASAGDEASHAMPPTVRSAVERGIFDGLKPLPYTLHELTEIRRLFPEDAVRIHLGDAAREERAKAEAGKARILHFATHGLADPEAPLDSFLALTIPPLGDDAPDNGILQAWEILQRPIEADLVVLSACETAIGERRGGEGLASLSQYFQSAGARTVAASLWSVNDASTSELMIRFYRHLRDGKHKNEALQAAQLELIRGPIKTFDEDGKPVTRDFTAPYHWAAFQVIGDWQ